MIQVQSACVTIDGQTILKDISLDLTERRIGIIGLNGSGKSTFSRLLNGLQLPTEGSVSVDGLDTKADGRKVRRKVGFVFQNPENQIVYPTVKEDLAFGLKNLKVDKNQVTDKVTAALDAYNLAHLADRFTHHLSGGEKQMVALIGVLIMAPQYVVMDEPTTLLDLRNNRRLMTVIEGLQEKVLMVTHDLDLLAGFDRVLCFHEGKIYADDQPDLAIKRYKTLCDP